MILAINIANIIFHRRSWHISSIQPGKPKHKSRRKKTTPRNTSCLSDRSEAGTYFVFYFLGLSQIFAEAYCRPLHVSRLSVRFVSKRVGISVFLKLAI